MALSSMSSIGLIAVVAGSVATGSLWSQRDPRMIEARRAETQMLSSACFADRSEGATGSGSAPTTPYPGCQAAFQSYSTYASWEALSHAAGR
jgi:hypothetical protein